MIEAKGEEVSGDGGPEPSVAGVEENNKVWWGCGLWNAKINKGLGVKSVYEFMYKDISVEMLLGGLGEELSNMGVYHPTL